MVLQIRCSAFVASENKKFGLHWPKLRILVPSVCTIQFVKCHKSKQETQKYGEVPTRNELFLKTSGWCGLELSGFSTICTQVRSLFVSNHKLSGRTKFGNVCMSSPSSLFQTCQCGRTIFATKHGSTRSRVVVRTVTRRMDPLPCHFQLHLVKLNSMRQISAAGNNPETCIDFPWSKPYHGKLRFCYSLIRCVSIVSGKQAGIWIALHWRRRQSA